VLPSPRCSLYPTGRTSLSATRQPTKMQPTRNAVDFVARLAVNRPTKGAGPPRNGPRRATPT